MLPSRPSGLAPGHNNRSREVVRDQAGKMVPREAVGSECSGLRGSAGATGKRRKRKTGLRREQRAGGWSERQKASAGVERGSPGQGSGDGGH